MEDFKNENMSPHGADDKKRMTLRERLAARRKGMEEQVERLNNDAAEQVAEAETPLEAAEESEEEQGAERTEYLSQSQLDLLTEMREILLREAEAEAAQEEAVLAMTEEGEEPIPLPPVNARVLLEVDRDELSVWGIFMPPKREGNPLTREAIKEKLKEAGVCNGILNLDALLEEPQYKTLLLLAEGQPVQNGEDGQVEDLFPREVQFHLEENDRQAVDFKQLNWLQQVKQGDPICRLIPATKSVNGKDVRGRILTGRDGVMPPIPQGTNTEVNAEQGVLGASCDGQLTFRKGAFHVEQVLQIPGNVDNGSGNLDVIGTVVITGNVNSGFAVKATGDIVVRGQVEGAHLKAGGNIQVNQGVKGAFKGLLEAKGNVQAKFMESCQISAGGSVVSESIINSQVSSGDRVTANTGKGVIIGGRISARNVIEAKSIGNESNRLTNLVVGADPSVLEQIRTLSREVKELDASIDGVEKNMHFLSKQPKLTPEHQKLAGQLKLKLSVEKMRLGQKQKLLESLREQLDDSGCQVLATTVFGGTIVEIGNQKLTVQREEKMCRIYKADGEIWVGSR